MQVKLLAVLAVCLLICGEAASDTAPSAGSDGGPRPPANWKPTGRVLLLPARQQTAQFYGAPPAEFTAARQLQSPPEYDEDVLTPPAEEDGITEIPVTEDYPTTTTETDESSDGFFFNTGDQQKEQPQVTSGVYHVLLPDGRLQRVEYTTAPLKQAAFTKSSRESNQFTQQNVEQTGFSQQNTRTNQASGQFTFQKPSYQSNQFALNSFKQNQYQENNLGQNSAQVPANGQYRTSHGSFSNPPSFYYQQQKEEPKSVYSQTPPKPLEVSNRTTQVKPVFVSVNFGSPQGKPAVSVHVPAQGEPDVNVHVPTQGKSDVNGQTQGKTFVRGQNQGTTATFGQTQGKLDVNGQTQSNSFVSGQNQGTTSGQIVSSYTYPQASYPSYTYQPIEFARQQDARDSTASPFVFNGYLASVEYPGQQPVVQPSPLYYSYSSAPLVRILRRTD